MRPHLQVPARRPSSCTPLGVHLWDGAFDTLSAATKHRLWLSLLLAGVLIVGRLVVAAVLRSAVGTRHRRGVFWSRQALSLGTLAAVALIVAAVWFNGSASLGTFSGFLAAGLAFALQKVVTAFAGYLVILRGETFTVGDRITMGGVRGDVVALGFFQTTIMEMGEPPPVQDAAPAVWVHSRQFTGRIVTVTNSKIFDEPVYNYTREFPFIWEEMHLPVAYRDDRHKAEQILLEAAKKHAVDYDKLDPQMVARLEKDYRVQREDFTPRAYWRLTDNWLDVTVRFITHDHGTRGLKDAMSREVLAQLEENGIGIASSTFEITGLPEVKAKLSS
jgi:small-conductance mechanosensitive channel